MNTQTLLAIVDNLADGFNYKRASIAAGTSVRSFWRAIKASQEGIPGYMVRYLDEDMTFAEACGSARRVHSMQVRSSFEQYCLTGWAEVVTHDGAIQYQKDPALIGKPWLVELLGLPDDYLRNSKGEVLPLTVVRKPSDAAVLRFLEGADPDFYRPSSTQNIVTTNLKAPTRPVMRGNEMGDPPPLPPPRPPIPELEVLADPELAEMLGEMDTPAPEPEPDAPSSKTEQPEPFDKIEPALEPQPGPERVIRDDPPSNISPELRALLNRTPRSDLERDLISKATSPRPT